MNKNEIKIGLISLGCAKNQVDAEVMLKLVADDGYTLTNDEAEADIIIINTCGFIDSAKQEAIDAIFEAAEYKKKGLLGIVVTGCLAQRYGKEIQAEIPEVDAIVGAYGYGNICDAIEAVLSKKKYFYDEENYSLDYLNSGRILTTPKSFAYLKIAEGCSNRCTYCAIPGIRGKFRSRKLSDIISEAKTIAQAGVKELVVVAQDTTMYGTDISADGKSLLPELLAELEKLKEIKFIRILYLYPDEVTDEIITAIKNSKKVVHYFDIPLQHISNRVLKRMNRRGDGKLYRKVINDFRKAMPDCVIRTSLISGFPGETEEDHVELLDFIKEYKLDRVGIFAYSKEDGTPAARLDGQIHGNTKKRRRNELMKAQQLVSLEKNKKRVGKTYEVIVDGFDEENMLYIGRSYMEAPEEDGNIYFAAHEELSAGDIVPVKILIAEEYDLTGEQK